MVGKYNNVVMILEGVINYFEEKQKYEFCPFANMEDVEKFIEGVFNYFKDTKIVFTFSKKATDSVAVIMENLTKIFSV